MKMNVTHWIVLHALSKSTFLHILPGTSSVFSGFMIHSSVQIIEYLRGVKNFLHRLREKIFDYVFADIIA